MFAPPLITEAAKVAPGMFGKLKLGFELVELELLAKPGTEEAIFPEPAVSATGLLIYGRYVLS